MRKAIILLIFSACASSQNEALNKQSIELHEAAMQVGKQISEKIGELEALQDSSLMDSVMALKQGYEAWEESIVEVPGHEHDHHDHDHEGHDHDHDHSPSPDLTPEMVLEIQTELKANAEVLNQRADRILEMVKSDNQ